MNTRTCGDCQLCCKLLPVSEIGKPAATRCQHQKHGTGCAIYDARPRSCRLWSCLWLVGEGVEDLRRPDRTRYVIDMMPDYITITHEDQRVNVPVVQVWIDDDYPDAHRDPALRAYLERRGMPAIVRGNANKTGLCIFPPSMAEDRQWHEVESNCTPENQHTAQQIAAVLRS